MLSVFVSGGRTRASFNGAPTVEDTFAIGDVRFRSVGFTHSIENLGTQRFTSVIVEFASSPGERMPSTLPATRSCNPGSTTAFVDVTSLFCTGQFCVVPSAISLRPPRIAYSSRSPTTHSGKSSRRPTASASRRVLQWPCASTAVGRDSSSEGPRDSDAVVETPFDCWSRGWLILDVEK